jgi:hypothetical protein
MKPKATPEITVHLYRGAPPVRGWSLSQETDKARTLCGSHNKQGVASTVEAAEKVNCPHCLGLMTPSPRDRRMPILTEEENERCLKEADALLNKKNHTMQDKVDLDLLVSRIEVFEEKTYGFGTGKIPAAGRTVTASKKAKAPVAPPKSQKGPKTPPSKVRTRSKRAPLVYSARKTRVSPQKLQKKS